MSNPQFAEHLPGEIVQPNPKISLRDYFAGLAMQAFISNDLAFKGVTQGRDIQPALMISGVAYEYADAMMKVRNIEIQIK